MQKRLIALALALLAGAGVAFHHFHGDGHSHGGGGRLQLNSGKKWETDQPLREGMGRIREIVIAASPAGGNAGMETLARGIQQQVDYLITNCKLPPAADETLHVILADLLEGAEIVTKQNDPRRGIDVMRTSLGRYAEHFDHPGWLALGDT